MKICPRCGTQGDNDDKYCVECKTNIENEKIVKHARSKVQKRVRTSIGCIVLVVAILAVVLIIALVYSGSKSDFGAWYFQMVGERR